MLALTAVVIAGFFTVYTKLSGDVRLSDVRVGELIEPLSQLPELSMNEDIPIQAEDTASPAPTGTQPAAAGVSASPAASAAPTPERTTAVPPPSATPSPAPSPTPAPGGSFTLTAGGTVALEMAVRQAGYSKSTGSYVFTDVFSLISGSIEADLSYVELENLVIAGASVSALIAPEEVMSMLSAGGLDYVALGFNKVYEQGWNGLTSTRLAAESVGLELFGVHNTEDEAVQLHEVNGIRVALLHCVESLSDKSRSAMKKDGRSWAVSTADSIAGEIEAARAAGAQCVIVSVHWGTRDKNTVSKAQKTLAQKIADAGADVIIGSGARVAKSVEWLDTQRNGQAARCLCAYDLGCLLSESRKAMHLAGMLLHLQISCDSKGTVRIDRVSYTPTYFWRYKQGSAYGYRLLASNATAPDGMSADEKKNMQSALKRIQSLMEASAISEE